MVDDARDRLVAHTSQLRHFEHRRTLIARIAFACHAPSPFAHNCWYVRLLYTQLQLALTTLMLQGCGTLRAGYRTAAKARRRAAKLGQSVRMAVSSLRLGTSSTGTHSISMLS